MFLAAQARYTYSDCNAPEDAKQREEFYAMIGRHDEPACVATASLSKRLIPYVA